MVTGLQTRAYRFHSPAKAMITRGLFQLTIRFERDHESVYSYSGHFPATAPETGASCCTIFNEDAHFSLPLDLTLPSAGPKASERAGAANSI